MNYNRVMLAGNLTRDPELANTNSGHVVCKFGMAVNRTWKDKKEILYVDLAAWGKTAEIIAQYVKKGQPLFIEGRLQLEQWTSREGQKRSKHSIVVDSFQFVGAKQDSGGQHPGTPPGDCVF